MEAVDEFAEGFGWIEEGFMQRCSHALVADRRVWVIDPVDADGVEDRVRASGSPAGVIQLLDRHKRDCAALANRLGVPHHVVPQEGVGPFEFLTIRMSRRWREVALWWPDARVLVCADALGTASYFRLRRGRLGLYPMLRLRRPRELAGLAPETSSAGMGRACSATPPPPWPTRCSSNWTVPEPVCLSMRRLAFTVILLLFRTFGGPA